MHPVQDFKDNFEKTAQDRLELEHPVDLSVDVIQLHTDQSSVRNVCFVWPDGRKAFFNYAYLIAAEFNSNTEQNIIRLDFSSHSVSLSGYILEPLYVALLDHLPRIITVIDPRYVLAKENVMSVVMSITVSTDK